ncbi:MAG: bifunctional metallophosphatase/5'-nucleotidase [Bacteroidota bacterium]
MKIHKLVALCLALCFAACSVSVRTSSDKSSEQPKSVEQRNPDIVELTFLQLNDVYEITPVEGGKFGGMARVATVKKELVQENPNTFTVLSGDFISPSAVGTSSYQGKRINGAQMVAAMNSVGVDFVCFGNHEFDLGYEPLQSRINESKFTWISSNILYTPSVEGGVKPFEKVVDGKEEPFPESYIIKAKNSSGAEVKIGVLGLTIGSNKPPYVVWNDPFESARRVVNGLKPKTDFIVALTHLSIEEDNQLASLVPEIKLILGGHEHTNMMFKVGEALISKADANARTAYIHRLRWSSSKKSLTITSELKAIDASIAEEPATAKIVNEWTTRAYAGFQEKGFNPEEVVATLKEPLDGRESSIRYRQTNLGSLIAKAMVAAAKNAKIAVFNSGSIRLDDQLSGVATQYDIIRTMPFGGKIVEAEMKGSLLQKLLDAGASNVGKGGFLQYEGVVFDSTKKAWSVARKAVEPAAKYWVIVSDYLFSGKEQGVEFFKKDNPDVVSVNEPNASDTNDLRRDIRLAVIEYLKKN